MKLSLVGGVPEARLLAALARAQSGPHESAERNGLAWVNLADAAPAEIAAVQAALGGPLTVIELEVRAGRRGDELRARRYTVPPSKAVDLSRSVGALLAEWRAAAGDDADERFTPELAALDLALVCAEDVRPPPAVPMGGGAMPLKRRGNARPTLDPRHEQWAAALVAHLRAAESLDTTGDALPLRRIAALLETHEQDGALTPGFGEALLELLVDHEAVEEVFADEAELTAAALATRPR